LGDIKADRLISQNMHKTEGRSYVILQGMFMFFGNKI